MVVELPAIGVILNLTAAVNCQGGSALSAKVGIGLLHAANLLPPVIRIVEAALTDCSRVASNQSLIIFLRWHIGNLLPPTPANILY